MIKKTFFLKLYNILLLAMICGSLLPAVPLLLLYDLEILQKIFPYLRFPDEPARHEQAGQETHGIVQAFIDSLNGGRGNSRRASIRISYKEAPYHLICIPRESQDRLEDLKAALLKIWTKADIMTFEENEGDPDMIRRWVFVSGLRPEYKQRCLFGR